MTTSPARTRTIVQIDKAPDLKSHLRYVEVDGVQVIELRDWVPSLGEYRRGYWFPADERQALIKALQDMK